MGPPRRCRGVSRLPRSRKARQRRARRSGAGRRGPRERRRWGVRRGEAPRENLESVMCMNIAGRSITSDGPLFVIGEIGLNHGGELAEALAMVDVAALAGASAVKLQSLRGETLVTAACPAPAYVDSASLQDFFRQFELDEAAHAAIAERARFLGMAFM